MSKTEIERAFAEGPSAQFGPVLTLDELATLFRTKKKTLYEWIAKGRLDGAFGKRGKHHLIWRDRAIDLLGVER